MTQQELLSKALYYGKQAIHWRYKFIGLLPEINRLRLFEKKNCTSIFEFAFKFGGLSEEQVRLALNLEKKFEKMPALKKLLTNGVVSINKLVRVASIATQANEMDLANAVQLLPQKAIETFVRDEKQNGLFQPEIEVESLRAQDLNLNYEVKKKLLELQEKGIDLNQVLLEFLEKREKEIQSEKAEISAVSSAAVTRYIPVGTRKVLKKEYGNKCSISTCTKPAEHIHHTQIFALGRSHDPHFLAPLCKEHHTIAHAINLKVQEKRREVLVW